MSNSTLTYFILGAYFNVGNLRYLYFVVTALIYMIVLFVNISLVAVICMNRTLHEPMYMFLCSLFVNELYGSAGLFPFLLLHILSDVHVIPASFCFLQIFCIYTYACVEFLILAVMSYDRYLAICCPLQYNKRMTSHRVFVLIIVIWLYSFMKTIMNLSLSSNLLLCGNLLNSLYCNNYMIVRLACSDTKVNNVIGLFNTVLTIIVPLLPIAFSYVTILRICFSGSRQTRQKAVSTCTPQLVSLINFSFGCFFEIVQSRFDMSNVPGLLKGFLSLYFLIIQPLLNPIMYGMQMSKIRKIYRDVFYSHTMRFHKELF